MIDRYRGQLSRRDLLRIVGGGTAAALALRNPNTSQAHHGPNFFPRKDTEYPLPDQNKGYKVRERELPYQELDRNHLRELFEKLQQPSSASADERAAAVDHNVVAILNTVQSSDPNFPDARIVQAGNALRIGGGLYVTSNNFLDEIKGAKIVQTEIFDPYDRGVYTAHNCLYDPDSFIVFLHAPDNGPDEPVKNLHLDLDPVVHGYDKLWASEIRLERYSLAGTLVLDTGSVDAQFTVDEPNFPIQILDDILAPWEYSGAPIRNDAGSVVGVLTQRGYTDFPGVMTNIAIAEQTLMNGEVIRLLPQSS